MRFLDALFGRSRLERPKTDALFGLVTATVDLEDRIGWVPTKRAAVCLKPVSTTDFAAAEMELEQLVRLAARDSSTQVESVADQYRYRWLLLEDEDFEDLVGVIHIAGQELHGKGYGSQLLAAIFRFAQLRGDGAHYLIYSYKRGTFYPFIPLNGQRRDTAAELRVASLLPRILPAEQDHTRWYPLWDCPV